MSINKLNQINEFARKFSTRAEAEKIRQAVVSSLVKKTSLSACKQAIKLLKKWFITKLYVEGRTPKDLATMVNKFDYGQKIGIGFSIEEAIKKGDFTYGRFLNHLLLFIEDKDSKIKYIENEVNRQKENLLEYENSLQELMYNLTVPEDLRNILQTKFYWLQKVEED